MAAVSILQELMWPFSQISVSSLEKLISLDLDISLDLEGQTEGSGVLILRDLRCSYAFTAAVPNFQELVGYSFQVSVSEA